MFSTELSTRKRKKEMDHDANDEHLMLQEDIDKVENICKDGGKKGQVYA